MQLTVLDEIESKMLMLESRLRIAENESLPIASASGRILAQDILNFRDSPAMDVSAMDGYACRWSDLQRLALADASGRLTLPVQCTTTAGSPPAILGAAAAVRIFTGAVVPQGADVVIPRERCNEETESVSIEMPMEQIKLGWNIRRQGENARAGEIGLQSGQRIDGPRMSSIVSMSQQASIRVHRQVRVTIINTGDELLDVGESIEPWQIRDSNGPLLESMLGACPWVQWTRISVKDDLARIQSALADALTSADAVVLTGGVSMGDTDHVPAAVRNCGAEVVFHRLPIRPGAPILGACTPGGQLVLGLPGNPVSVAVTFVRFGLPMIERIAGMRPRPRSIPVELANADNKKLHLVWYRLVQIQADGTALLVSNQGSGDIRSLGFSDGFVEVPVQTDTKGRFPFYGWSH